MANKTSKMAQTEPLIQPLLRPLSRCWLALLTLITASAAPLAAELGDANAEQELDQSMYSPTGLKTTHARLRRPRATNEAAATQTFYTVTELKPEYVWERDGTLNADQMLDVSVSLERTERGWDVPRDETKKESIKLSEISTLAEQRFSRRALQAVFEAVVGRFHQEGIYGVYVAPNELDISSEGADVRPAGKSPLRLAVRVPVLGEVHTLAQGNRVSPDDKVDSPVHQRILNDSPVGVGGFIIKDHLNNFVHYLNRHPGRQVHMTVAPAAEGKEGEAKIDYVVTEGRQWNLFAHVANTGTKDTSDWRETFGFRHNQLTNHDDILILNYSTASFTKSHAVFGSYDSYIPYIHCLRSKTSFGYSTFRATDVGNFDIEFRGHTFDILSRLSWNFFQTGPSFFDLFVGTEWKNINVRQSDAGDEIGQGREDFTVLQFGARAERFTDDGNTTAEIRGDWNLSLLGSTDRERLERLGRLGVDRRWFLGIIEMSHSCYLDKLFGSQNRANLIEFLVRGQHAFGSRLVPQGMMTAGGQNSVRGYPESIAAGDSGIVGSIEYRFYVPRYITPGPGTVSTYMGRDFRWAPEVPGGRADWDLALSVYTDAAQMLHHARRLSYERNNTLWGVGVGAELVIWNNFRIRGDMAWPLTTARTSTERVRPGDIRGHVSAAVIY